MPSIINAPLSGGVTITSDTSGVLQLQTASTTALTVDTSANIGIGTASPGAPLQVNGTATAVRATSGQLWLSRTTVATQYQGICFRSGPARDAFIGRIPNSDDIVFGFDAGATLSEQLRLNTSGNLVLAGGTTTANGVGITFPATQSASSDANTLDDYEEGTWTPTIGGTATYNAQVGYYTKIGNVVTVTFTIHINVIGTGGLYTITSLPFVSRSGPVPAGSVGYFSNINSNVYSINCYVDPNSTNLSFVGQTSFTSSNSVPINVFKNNAFIYGAVTYFV